MKYIHILSLSYFQFFCCRKWYLRWIYEFEENTINPNAYYLKAQPIEIVRVLKRIAKGYICTWYCARISNGMISLTLHFYNKRSWTDPIEMWDMLTYTERVYGKYCSTKKKGCMCVLYRQYTFLIQQRTLKGRNIYIHNVKGLVDLIRLLS